MIKLVTRQEAYRLQPVLGRHILNIQNEMDPGLAYRKYISEDNSGEAEEEWNREQEEEYNKIRDHIDQEPPQKRSFGEVILSIESESIARYVKKLSSTFAKLAHEMSWNQILFLIEFDMPWLYQDNDYKPVKDALDYWRSLGITDDFNGGVIVDEENIVEFMTHFFWICRCNASLPAIYFAGLKSKITGGLCKYGNLHFYCYSYKEQYLLWDYEEFFGLVNISQEGCYETLSKSGEIEGRKMMAFQTKEEKA